MFKFYETFAIRIVRNRNDEPQVISLTYTYLNTYWCTEEYSTEIYRQYLRHIAPQLLQKETENVSEIFLTLS
jgi:hypothetical protein